MQCRRPGFSPWVGKIWRKGWQPTLVFLPGESHGQRNLEGYSSWGLKELDRIEQLTQTHKNKHKQEPCLECPRNRGEASTFLAETGGRERREEDRFRTDLMQPQVEVRTLTFILIEARRQQKMM